MKNLVGIICVVMLMGCGHHDKTKAEVYYIYPEDPELEPEDPECEGGEDDESHHGHGHHQHDD
jgi:hypothetical protein